jgi:tRNA nucleotidyltransferase/poly(A) polymerase
VRFAARLDFAIEPTTHAAICENAGALEKVAAERIHDELARMLTHHRRQRAFQLLWETRLLSHLWPGAAWTAGQVARANALLQALPTEADFPLALAALLSDRPLDEVHTIARALACSNEERETAAWLIDHQADLDRPSDLSLAELKRLLQHRAFANLRALTGARLADAPDRAARLGVLDQRAQSIIPAQIEPAPFVTGDDLKQLGHAPGPYFKRVLDELYTRQLNEELSERDVALAIARQLLEDGER